MYNGKHQNNKIVGKKPIALLVSLVLLLTVAIGGTLAYLVANAGPVENIFTPTSVPNEVTETLDGDVKKDVKIKNQGNIDAYIRAAVVVTWVDENNSSNVYGVKPVEGTDYTITRTENGWVKYGDYYYYTGKVAPGAETGVLFTGCTPVAGKAPEGYHLSVEVMGQSIQSEPARAVGEAWGVTISEGSVTAYTAN